jgi:very-short-patch-repair endonuclease
VIPLPDGIPLIKGDKDRRRFFLDEHFKKRGLVFIGRHVPYNPRLTARARELRKNMTPTERKLWFNFLRNFSRRVCRQKPIDNYIVDFYYPSLKLVIELDGSSHATHEGKEYDRERDDILKSYGLQTLRFTNHDVMNRFEKVCLRITEMIPPKPL